MKKTEVFWDIEVIKPCNDLVISISDIEDVEYTISKPAIMIPLTWQIDLSSCGLIKYWLNEGATESIKI